MNAKMEWQFDPMMEEAFEKPIYPDYFAFIDQTLQKRVTSLWFGEEEEEKRRRKRQDEEEEIKDKSKISFVSEVLDFVKSGDLGKSFRESEAYMDWKWEQEELGWPEDGEEEEQEEDGERGGGGEERGEEGRRDERDLEEEEE